MNFVKNVFDAALKQNSDGFMNEHVDSVEELMTTQSCNGSENNYTVVDEFSSKKIYVELNIENFINLSKDEDTLNVDEFLNNNNELVRNNKLDTEIELALHKTNEGSIIDINDFEQVLKEFRINRDKFPKSDNNVDSDSTLNINEEVLNLDEFDELFDSSFDLEESEMSNNNKIALEEHNTLDINKMHLFQLRQFRKSKRYSDNETPTGQTIAEFERLHEIQFPKTNKVENIEEQLGTIQKNTCINKFVATDLTTEEDNRLEMYDTENQICIKDNKIENTQDISMQNLTNDIQDAVEVKHEFDHTRIISIHNENITECKLEKDNITIDFVNERDNTTANSNNGATDVDTISLLSIESNLENVDLDFCNGYHSSDFEFITESDAEIQGPGTDTLKAVEIKKKTKSKHVVSNNKLGSSKDFNNSKVSNHNTNKQIQQPSASNSKTNISFTNFNKNAVNYGQVTQNTRPNHAIPEGEEYLNLFQGIYAPVYTDLFFLENKSVRAQTCMNVQYEGVGFDIKMSSREDSDEDNKEEAHENVKKILELYPIENRSKRKRRRM